MVVALCPTREQNGQKRILDKTLNLHDQLLLLIGSDSVTVEHLDHWTVYYKPQYLGLCIPRQTGKDRVVASIGCR